MAILIPGRGRRKHRLESNEYAGCRPIASYGPKEGHTMDIGVIVDQARSLAQAFKDKGHEEVRLPVFSFEDWREVYGREADGQALADFRIQQKRNWYLMHFLRRDGVKVKPVPIFPGQFHPWAEQTGHKLDNGHDLAHAVGEYVNRPETPVSMCRHHEAEDLAAREPQLMGTITVFGETPQAPEIMSAVLHRPDGSVLSTLEILAVECSPQDAWQRVEMYLDDHQPSKVFHDKTIRRPEYCDDCNGLLVNVASPQEINAQG